MPTMITKYSLNKSATVASSWIVALPSIWSEICLLYARLLFISLMSQNILPFVEILCRTLFLKQWCFLITTSLLTTFLAIYNSWRNFENFFPIFRIYCFFLRLLAEFSCQTRILFLKETICLYCCITLADRHKIIIVRFMATTGAS